MKINRKYGIVIIFCLITCTQFYSQSPEYINYKWRADSLYRYNHYRLAIRQYQQIIYNTKDARRSDYYGIACCYSKLFKIDSAFLYLDTAVLKKLIYTDIQIIDKDTNLWPLYKYSHWKVIKQKIIDNINYSFNNPYRNDKLRKEICNMVESENDLNNQYMSLELNNSSSRRDSIAIEIDFVRKKNQVALKNIVLKYGWPGWTMVGQDGENAAWIIAQHSDFDTLFQKYCMIKLKEAANNYDASFSNFAYLQDRLLVNEGKEQIYGTQYRIITTSEGAHIEYLPIWDEKNVNKRRFAMGMELIDEYTKRSLKHFNISK